MRKTEAGSAKHTGKEDTMNHKLIHISNSQKCVDGTKHGYHEWLTLASDNFILETISGYKIKFNSLAIGNNRLFAPSVRTNYLHYSSSLNLAHQKLAR